VLSLPLACSWNLQACPLSPLGGRGQGEGGIWMDDEAKFNCEIVEAIVSIFVAGHYCDFRGISRSYKITSTPFSNKQLIINHFSI
jgi:hypothetical protein